MEHLLNSPNAGESLPVVAMLIFISAVAIYFVFIAIKFVCGVVKFFVSAIKDVWNGD